MNLINKSFDIISSSGDSYLLMRHTKACECLKPVEVVPYINKVETEEDVSKKLFAEFSEFLDCFTNLTQSNTSFCDKCFKLGKIYNPIKTEPFRKVETSSLFSNRNQLEPSFVSMENRTYNIYLDSKYSTLTFDDLICNLISKDGKEVISSVFKIIGKEVKKFNDFEYVELVVTNINYAKLEGVGVFEYVRKTK